MSYADRKVKDQNMSSALKDRNVLQGRSVQLCPICYKLVPNLAFGNHISAHR